MPIRNWTPEQRAKQSVMTVKNRPFDHSTGPVSSEGRRIVSRNAHQHGFYDSTFQEFRRTQKRSKPVRNIESLCKKLFKEKEPERMLAIAEQIEQKINAYHQELDSNEVKPEIVLEGAYLDLLIIKLANYKIFSSMNILISQLATSTSLRHR
jgi:hypothetical protein